MSLPNLQNYRLIKELGSGSYSKVYTAVPKEGSTEVVAIKLMHPSLHIDDVCMEIEILRKLKHDHIVELKKYFKDGYLI